MNQSINEPKSPQVPTPIRVVRSEASPPYDGAPEGGGRVFNGHVTVCDDQIIDVMAADLGAVTFAVYIVLERHVGADGECRVSYRGIAKKLSIGRSTAIRSVKTLVGAGLVVVRHHRNDQTMRAETNTFALPRHLSPSVTAGPPSLPVALPSVTAGLGVVSQRDYPSVTAGLKVDTLEVDTIKVVDVKTPLTPHLAKSDPKTKTYPAEFETFWAAYPKGHGNKKPSFDKWRQLNPDTELVGQIMAGLERWRRSERWEHGFIKNADIWLRERWFEDDPPAANVVRPKTAADHSRGSQGKVVL